MVAADFLSVSSIVPSVNGMPSMYNFLTKKLTDD